MIYDSCVAYTWRFIYLFGVDAKDIGDINPKHNPRSTRQPTTLGF